MKMVDLFPIKYTLRILCSWDQKQRRNGEASDVLLVEPDKLDIKGHLRGFLLIRHYKSDLTTKRQRNK